MATKKKNTKRARRTKRVQRRTRGDRSAGRKRPILRATIEQQALDVLEADAARRDWPVSRVLEALILAYAGKVNMPVRPYYVRPIRARLPESVVAIIQQEAKLRGLRPQQFLAELVLGCAHLVAVEGFPRQDDTPPDAARAVNA